MPKSPSSKLVAPRVNAPATDKNAVTVNTDAQKFDLWLDGQLRGMFEAVAAEPVPQELLDLIKSKSGGDAES